MKIRYIGKKAKKTDNVSGTGLVWHGAGDVQEVPTAAAHKLLAHTGIWVLDDVGQAIEDVVTQAEAPAIPVRDEVEDEPPPLVDLNGMSKNDLESFAMRQFNVNLDKRKSKESLIHEVQSMMNAGSRFGR